MIFVLGNLVRYSVLGDIPAGDDHLCKAEEEALEPGLTSNWFWPGEKLEACVKNQYEYHFQKPYFDQILSSRNCRGVFQSVHNSIHFPILRQLRYRK